MNINTSIKNLGNNIRFKASTISSLIENRRLNNYCTIICRAYADYKIDKTHMYKRLRASSAQTRTRFTHQEAAANIAKILASGLKLNVDLAEAIASNHDIGHTFYGHDGGWWISEIDKDEGTGQLCHNAQGPRFLIYGHSIHEKIMKEIEHLHSNLSERKLNKIRKSLWKVDDGIWCHNGETPEKEFRPNLRKTETDFTEELKKGFIIENFENDSRITSSTIEGCLIRPADIISYFCRDAVDGLREGFHSELDQKYISILNSLGIPTEDIERYLVKKDYETLSRRAENVVIKAVLDKSDKKCIRIPKEVSILVKKMRDLNNERLVKRVTRPTEALVFPPAIRSLRNTYRDILLDNNLLERICTANEDLNISKELTEKYKDTPHMQFIEWICRTTPEHYKFLEDVIDDCILHTTKEETMEAIELLENDSKLEGNEKYSMRNARILNTMKYFSENTLTGEASEEYISSLISNINDNKDAHYLGKREQMAKKLATFFIAELTDIEFVQTLVNNGLVTKEQLEDLHKKFSDINFSEDDSISITDAWAKISKNQTEALAEEERG